MTLPWTWDSAPQKSSLVLPATINPCFKGQGLIVEELVHRLFGQFRGVPFKGGEKSTMRKPQERRQPNICNRKMPGGREGFVSGAHCIKEGARHQDCWLLSGEGLIIKLCLISYTTGVDHVFEA